MKAEIRTGGELWIVAENPCEALALKQIVGFDVCDKCGQCDCHGRLYFDESALDNAEMGGSRNEDSPDRFVETKEKSNGM